MLVAGFFMSSSLTVQANEVATVELIDQIGSHIEITARRSPAKPFDRTADDEIDVPFLHVDRYHTHGLIRIQHDKRTDLVGASHNCVSGDS